MVDVWTYGDELPEVARLDNWVGYSLMIFGLMLVWFGCFGYNYLIIPGYLLMPFGALFLLFTESSIYLLEIMDENGEAIDAELVTFDHFIFRVFGRLFRNGILSGPYFGDELKALKMDLE